MEPSIEFSYAQCRSERTRSRAPIKRIDLGRVLFGTGNPIRWRRMVSAMRMLGVALVLLLARAWAAEVIPPAPRDHFNDYAGMVAPDFARQLNDELTQFERETSNQVVVALYPKMQSNSSIEDYAVRVAQAWGVGQKDRKNGAVMFVFKDDRAIFIQVGYGLEGVLPDVRCKQIIENEITPRFRAGDFQGGVGAGVRAIMASIRGEYQGTGATVKDATNRGRSGGIPGGFILLIFLAIIIRSIFGNRRNSVYSRNGRRGIWMLPGSGGGWGGGGWSSGGGSSGGGGSFSGGGGSFGGGGAGGRW